MNDDARSAWRRAATRCIAVLLVLGSAGLAAAGEPVSMAPASVGYHRPTDVFNVLDNLSDWLPGYTSSAYRDYWVRHLGLDEEDRALLAAYAGFRQRTSPLARQEEEDAPVALFAPASTRDADAFSRHFFEAPSVAAGVSAAIAAQSAGDRRMLQTFFARFVPRAERLLGAGQDFSAPRKVLASQLGQPAVLGLGEAIRAFYAVPSAPVFDARFVWWPDPDSTQAKVRGRYILLHSQHVGAEAAAQMDWAPIVLHEFAHYVSAGQAAERKRRVAASLLRRCAAAAELRNPLNALEEPLAIYWGQYRFEHDVRGGLLSLDDQWYLQPWADRAAKAIARAYPATGPAPALEDPALIEAAASACAE